MAWVSLMSLKCQERCSDPVALLAGALLLEATEKAQRIPQLLPGNKPLRARYISFLHRMVRP